MHRVTPNWTGRLNSQKYPMYTKYLPLRSKFWPASLYGQGFPRYRTVYHSPLTPMLNVPKKKVWKLLAATCRSSGILEMVFLENRQCAEWPQYDLERYNAKGTPYMSRYYPRVPNYTPFCSTIARIPDNWAFWFLHSVQWWIWNLKKNR